MRRIQLVLIWFSCAMSMTALADSDKISQPAFFTSVKHRLSQIWYEGTTDLYLTGYAWHNRYTYTPEQIASKHYNEFAEGGGLGKGFYDEDGDWHALSVMGFADSNRHFQPLAGYTFQKMLTLQKKTRLGGGFTWFVTSRKEIMHGVPFIGIPLPMVSLTVARVSVFATYVPGLFNTGNVLFVFGKWTF